MSPAPIAILSNALSTLNQTGGAWLDGLVADHHWVSRHAFDDVNDIPKILADCEKAGIGTVAVDGGDGTAGLVFSALLNDGPYKNPPTLALIPSGKTNMTAEAWGLTGSRKKALANLIRKGADGNLDAYISEQPVLAVHNGGSSPPQYGAFFGGADVVEGILYCRRAIYPLGLPNFISHSAAIAVLLWQALSSGQTGDTLRAVFDDAVETEEGRFFVVLATTMDRMLLGLRPMPEMGTGPLHYISLRPGAGAVLSALPGLIVRRVAPGIARTVRRCGAVSLSLSGSYTLDGELFDAIPDRPVTLDGHQKLRFIRW